MYGLWYSQCLGTMTSHIAETARVSYFPPVKSALHQCSLQAVSQSTSEVSTLPEESAISRAVPLSKSFLNWKVVSVTDLVITVPISPISHHMKLGRVVERSPKRTVLCCIPCHRCFTSSQALWPLSDPPSLILQLEWHSDTRCWSSTNPCREQWWQHIFTFPSNENIHQHLQSSTPSHMHSLSDKHTNFLSGLVSHSWDLWRTQPFTQSRSCCRNNRLTYWPVHAPLGPI